jgi:hypothetical protein
MGVPDKYYLCGMYVRKKIYPIYFVDTKHTTVARNWFQYGFAIHTFIKIFTRVNWHVVANFARMIT